MVGVRAIGRDRAVPLAGLGHGHEHADAGPVDELRDMPDLLRVPNILTVVAPTVSPPRRCRAKSRSPDPGTR